MPTRYDAVFFDLDGTLIDSGDDIAASVNHVRRTRSLGPLPADQIKGYIGDGVRILLERAFSTTDDAVIARCLEIMRPHYLEHCLDRTALYPGIRSLLTDLVAIEGLALAVVSNKPEHPSEKVLTGLGVRDCFRAVIGGDSAGVRKPDPAPFLMAADRAGVSGRRILVVGDSPNDIEGARRAGYASCGVLWGLGTPERVRGSHPDHVASTPEDVRSLIVS